jgi:hypothetical protein
MPTSLMKQVVRIFAVVWLVLNERVLWKETRRAKCELLLLLLLLKTRRASEKRRPSSLLTFNLSVPEGTAYSQRTKPAIERLHNRAYIHDTRLTRQSLTIRPNAP